MCSYVFLYFYLYPAPARGIPLWNMLFGLVAQQKCFSRNQYSPLRGKGGDGWKGRWGGVEAGDSYILLFTV